MTELSATTRQLPLHHRHEKLGARFGEFGDWQVPLYYTSILEEHESVRQRAGIFDVSHMGQFKVTGPDAEQYLDKMVPRNIRKMPAGRAWYALLLAEHGGILDDIIVYRLAQEDFTVIVNASNLSKDYRWFESHCRGDMQLRDVSESHCLFALQGPGSVACLREVFGEEYVQMKYYHCMKYQSGMIARTGYTGEDGFELMVPVGEAEECWDRLFAAGKSEGLRAVGFGARDTLRLEAGMPLYGHELNENINPFEARIDWCLDFEKEDFIGRKALERIEPDLTAPVLTGFELTGRGIARDGCDIVSSGRKIGRVTSGTFSPTLKKSIGMGYLSRESAAALREFDVMIRDCACPARIVKLPFYSRKKK